MWRIMEFKKILITNFIKKSLEVYIIDIEFKNEVGKIKINTLASLSQEFANGKLFDIEPELLLLPKPGSLFELGLGPLTFNDADTKNQLQIGRNFLKIIIKKYETWGIEYDKIKKIFQLLYPIMEDITIKGFQIACINNFDDIKQEDAFKLSNYFTHFVESELDIEYEDFHLGFVPHILKNEEEFEKIILKLRGIPPKASDFFLFKLESLFFKRNLNVKLSDPKLLREINHGHDFLSYLFVYSLSKSYRDKIGLTFEIIEEE
ncbi:hypothetical protein LCGC14_1198730 [marine sediment metagenome]|uniref:Uncharacterized protein n=1 Tax=marine sediment metagenome TaxID=412755 RepID=A0A0F9LM25_9ZZZZ